MGLLENLTSEQGINGLLGNPLLNIGLGILANNTGHYGQFSPAVGLGGQQGLQAVQLQQQALARRKLLEMEAQKQQMEMEKQQRELDQQKRSQDFLSTLGQPNATRDVTQTTPDTYANAPQGATYPNFNMVKTPGQTTTTKESYYDPQTALLGALKSGTLDYKDYFRESTNRQDKMDLAKQTFMDKWEENRQKAEEGLISKEISDKREAALLTSLKMMDVNSRKSIAAMMAANRPEPAISTIRVIDDDPNSKYYGKPILKDGRTGNTLGLDSGLDVGAQRANASAKEEGKGAGAATTLSAADKASAKKALDSAGYNVVNGTDNVTNLLGEATSGIIGHGVDLVVGATGKSTKGSKANAALKAIGNKIIMQMIGGKLGTGISNADRDFIAAQIGDVGNPNIPVEDRLSAWNAAKERLQFLGIDMDSGWGKNNSNTPPPPAGFSVH